MGISVKVDSATSVAGKTVALVVAYAGVGDKIGVAEGAEPPTNSSKWSVAYGCADHPPCRVLAEEAERSSSRRREAAGSGRRGETGSSRRRHAGGRSKTHVYLAAQRRKHAAQPRGDHSTRSGFGGTS